MKKICMGRRNGFMDIRADEKGAQWFIRQKTKEAQARFFNFYFKCMRFWVCFGVQGQGGAGTFMLCMRLWVCVLCMYVCMWHAGAVRLGSFLVYLRIIALALVVACARLTNLTHHSVPYLLPTYHVTAGRHGPDLQAGQAGEGHDHRPDEGAAEPAHGGWVGGWAMNEACGVSVCPSVRPRVRAYIVCSSSYLPYPGPPVSSVFSGTTGKNYDSDAASGSACIIS